jgi:hypothetical protein
VERGKVVASVGTAATASLVVDGAAVVAADVAAVAARGKMQPRPTVAPKAAAVASKRRKTASFPTGTIMILAITVTSVKAPPSQGEAQQESRGGRQDSSNEGPRESRDEREPREQSHAPQETREPQEQVAREPAAREPREPAFAGESSPQRDSSAPREEAPWPRDSSQSTESSQGSTSSSENFGPSASEPARQAKPFVVWSSAPSSPRDRRDE